MIFFQFSSRAIQGCFYFVTNKFDDDCLAALCFKSVGHFAVLRGNWNLEYSASFNTTSSVEVYASRECRQFPASFVVCTVLSGPAGRIIRLFPPVVHLPYLWPRPALFQSLHVLWWLLQALL